MGYIWYWCVLDVYMLMRVESGGTVMDGRVDWVSWVLWGSIPQLDKFYPIQHGIELPWVRILINSRDNCES